jgi:isorenieratene synthase
MLGAMSILQRDDRDRRILVLGTRPATFAGAGELPPRGDDWRQARPARIRRALERALARPSGNWYVLAATHDLPAKPKRHIVDGLELVSWREGGVVRVAPDECPHMGASLAEGCVQAGRLVCPWHGLKLGSDGHGAWRPLAAHDDGLLTWVRLGPPVAGVPLPVVPSRPRDFIPAVITMQGRCAPADVIANRLDAWHGTHLHNHSFVRLRVLGDEDDVLRVRVAVRLVGRVCIETDCTFHSPEPRTIVMTIVDGEGQGSVVETHATPIAPTSRCDATRVIEATFATSPRQGFRVAMALRPVVSRLMARAAERLWRDDLAYAERLFALRERRGGERDAGLEVISGG